MPRHLALASLLALAVSLAASNGSAQPAAGASVSMEADRTQVDVGQPFRLSIRVASSGEPTGEPNLPDLSVFDRLDQRTGQQMSFGWGGRSEMVRTYVFTLSARRPGTYTISPARLRTSRGSVESQPVTIVVAGSGAAPVPAPPDAPGVDAPSGPGAEASKFDPDGYVRVVTDVAQPYVGQQVTVTVYYYSPGGAPAQMTRRSTADGAWRQDLGPVQGREIQTVRGHRFLVSVADRFAVFPLRAGPLVIGTSEIAESTWMGQIVRASPPLRLEVRPLPNGVPTDAAVGSFTLTVRLESPTARTGEAVSLVATIHGSGNLRDVRLASPNVPGVRIDPPQIEDRREDAQDLVGGERRISWLLVPEQPGRHVIPPLSLPVFDPVTERFETLRSSALVLQVTGAPIAPTQEPEPDDEPDDGAPEDTRDAVAGSLRTRAELTRARPPLSSRPWYPWALALGPVAFALALAARAGVHRMRRGAADPSRTRARAVKGHLAQARARLAAGDPRGFYTLVAKALTESVELRLGEPIGGYTHAALREHLVSRGMADDLAGRLVDELDGCDFARFSSVGAERAEMERCLERAGAVLERLGRFEPTQEIAS